MSVFNVLPLPWVVILMSLLTFNIVIGQCPVDRRSSNICRCNFENSNGYTVARSIVCTGLSASTTLVFNSVDDIFVDLIVKESALDHVIPFMFSRVKARNFMMADNRILSIDDNAFSGAEDYMESLDLSNNLISNLSPSIFKYLRFLKVIKLSNNRLTFLYKEMFEGLSKVTYMDLGSNRIIDIRSNALSEMPNLQTLLLNSNQIRDIKNDSFSGLDKLEVLHLSSNQISRIPDYSFNQLTNIRSLYIPQNDIPRLPENLFRMNELLEDLILRENELESLPENLFFRNKNLRYLDLSFNKLKNIQRFPFKKLDKLESLNLQNNEIKNIYKNVFEDLHKVLELNLAYNEIQYLEENGLAGLVVAQRVRLDNNKISSVPYGVFDAIGNVIYLNLSMNLIENFEDSVPFLANSMLVELDLSWNQIKEVPYTLFQKTISLKKLTIAHNKISLIYLDSFANIPNIEELDLSYNRINIPNGNLFYNCRKLKKLKLSWNPLHELRRSFFVGLYGLEELFLDHGCLRSLPDGLFNPVDDSNYPIAPPEFQQPHSLNNLKFAHFGSNFIQELKKAHLEGADLPVLYFQENNITSLDPELFARASSLKVANFSRNAFTSSVRGVLSKMKYVKELDLSHNQIETVFRRELELDANFDVLHLAGNPIVCDCEVAFLRAYKGLSDYDLLQCGPGSNNALGELAVCFPLTTLRCPNWPNDYINHCRSLTENDLKELSANTIYKQELYMQERSDYEQYCVIVEEVPSTTTRPIIFDHNHNQTIELPEITKITPTTKFNFIRVEWEHNDRSLVTGYRLTYTNTSSDVKYISGIIDDRLWYVLNNTSIEDNYLICIEVVLLDGQVKSDERGCRYVWDLTPAKVEDDSDKSGLLQLTIPIIAVLSVVLIIVLIIIGVRISLRRKRHRDKQQEAMTTAQKMGMWDFDFQPPVDEELVEQTTLPFDVLSETIIDPKFRLKKIRATIRGTNKMKRVKRRKSKGRQIPSVAGSMQSKSDSMTSVRSNTNSMDDFDPNLFVEGMLPPPYSRSSNGSVANISNGSAMSIGNGSVQSNFRGSGPSSTRGSVKSSTKGTFRSIFRNSRSSSRGKHNSGYESDNRSGN